jgi:hypothetical protein
MDARTAVRHQDRHTKPDKNCTDHSRSPYHQRRRPWRASPGGTCLERVRIVHAADTHNAFPETRTCIFQDGVPANILETSLEPATRR